MANIYVTEPGSMVETEAGQLLVTRHGDVLAAVPGALIDNVVLVGNSGVTTPALRFMLERGIGLVLLTGGGAFLGRLSPRQEGRVDLRRAQYRRLEEDGFCQELGRAFVTGKIRNCRTLCLRWAASRADPDLRAASGRMLLALDEARSATDRAGLMGVEGRATRQYFAALRRVLRPPWVFERRARRPPPDPVNALLSITYTLLQQSCYAALEAAGLDPYAGALHVPRGGRPALALDLMEEFRPLIADSVTVLLLNKRLLAPRDFSPHETDGVRLSRTGWRVVTAQYNKRLHTLVRPNGLDRSISYQKLLELQARRIARAVQSGDPHLYRPFLAK